MSGVFLVAARGLPTTWGEARDYSGSAMDILADLAGDTDPQVADEAADTLIAERGYHLIAPDITGIYEQMMKANGRRPEDNLIGFVNHLAIADSWEEAFQATAEPCMWVSNEYALRKGLDGVQPPESARVTMEMIRHAAENAEESIGRIFAVPGPGTVDQIIEKYLPLVRGQGPLITHLGFEVRAPGTSTEAAHRTMRLFAEHVMPVLREEAAKAGRLPQCAEVPIWETCGMVVTMCRTADSDQTDVACGTSPGKRTKSPRAAVISSPAGPRLPSRSSPHGQWPVRRQK